MLNRSDWIEMCQDYWIKMSAGGWNEIFQFYVSSNLVVDQTLAQEKRKKRIFCRIFLSWTKKGFFCSTIRLEWTFLLFDDFILMCFILLLLCMWWEQSDSNLRYTPAFFVSLSFSCRSGHLNHVRLLLLHTGWTSYSFPSTCTYRDWVAGALKWNVFIIIIFPCQDIRRKGIKT